MAYAWQTVEKAAVTLGISTRTIARRIAKGELQSRLSGGRREVYICLPPGVTADAEESREPAVETVQGELTDSDLPPQQKEEEYERTVRHTVAASSGSDADVETSTALILAEDRARRAELAISVIQSSTAIVRDEVRTARMAARWAWCVVAIMAAGTVAAVAWTASSVTRSQMVVEHLKERAQKAADEIDRTRREDAKLQTDLEQARLSAARVEGQLMEVRQEAEQAHAMIAKALSERRAPATQPAGKVAKAE